jgi:hypothetical protein
VDVRADGGYVVWWPREGLRVVSDAPIADWPEWLLGLARGGSGSRTDVITSLDLPTWEEALSNHYKSAKRFSREETFAYYALKKAMQRIASVEQGRREIALHGESYAIGRLIGAGWVSLGQAAFAIEHGIKSNTHTNSEGQTYIQEHDLE